MERITAWNLFLSGGPMMWPLLGCAVLACAVILERFFYFRSVDKEGERIGVILDLVRRNQIKEAVQSCEASASPAVRLLKAGILKYDRPASQIREALEHASLYEVPKLERNVPLLSTVAHAAPLLGLLGTAAGMTSCFYAIHHAQAAAAMVSAGDFAAGIWQSLLTTCAGLFVAVTAYIAHNYLVSRVNGLVLEMEQTSARLLDLLAE